MIFSRVEGRQCGLLDLSRFLWIYPRECFILTMTSKDCFKVKKKNPLYVTRVTFRVEKYFAFVVVCNTELNILVYTQRPLKVYMYMYVCTWTRLGTHSMENQTILQYSSAFVVHVYTSILKFKVSLIVIECIFL